MKYVQFFSVVVILTFVEMEGGEGGERGLRERMYINGVFASFVILSFKED